jgi:hypothetical protein
MMAIRQPVWAVELRHLSHLTDDRGIFEHAKGISPRFSHGYCTDDNARLLVVAVRHKESPDGSHILARVAARFLLDAQSDDGLIRNRMSFERLWLDEPNLEDCWGRAMWAFGTAVARSADTELRNRCYEAFDRGHENRSPYLRSMCFSVLGAAELLEIEPNHAGALRMMADARLVFSGLLPQSAQWIWHEERLTYANALIPEAMIAAGAALQDGALISRGVRLLSWLLERETFRDHLSVTPASGRGQFDIGPMFDQQPIEVATLADAVRRAHTVTGDSKWINALDLSVSWFLGNNDSGESMIDVSSGGGFDGLQVEGVNLNQGAESTLAMIATLQHCASTWLI